MIKRRLPIKKKRVGSHKRVDINPKGGDLARLGFYTAAVQGVVKKWSKEFPDHLIHLYFRQVAPPLVYRESECRLSRFSTLQDWSLILELGQALLSVLQDKEQPDSWLLGDPPRMIDYLTPPWQAVSDDIKRRGGPRFSVDCLKMCASRLRLPTSAECAKAWRSQIPSPPG